MELEICTGNFSLLPEHIIAKILGYLKLDDFKNASSICKSWYYASSDSLIAKTLIVAPRADNFSEICKSIRRFGVLKLQHLKFDKEDDHYFEFFKKFGPFVYKLHLFNSLLNINQLLKLLEYTTRLETITIIQCPRFVKMPELFPIDYDCELKTQIVKNLSGVKDLELFLFYSNLMPLMVDLLRCTTNLRSFDFSNEFAAYYGSDDNEISQFFTVLDLANAGKLTHLSLNLLYYRHAKKFIETFVNIKTLNLRSFNLELGWNYHSWIEEMYPFKYLISKLQNLKKLSIVRLYDDQLSFICHHLMSLKNFDFLLFSNKGIGELTNLKQLEVLRCHFESQKYTNYTITKDSILENEKFFKCKFENLKIFNFGECLDESNLLQLCENHPNLIELKLSNLLTRNLEIIFKYLTKLRVLKIYFGFGRLKRSTVNDEKVFEADHQYEYTDREYEYKISRLTDLEEIYLHELINEIREDDVRQLQKLRITNLSKLFSKRCAQNSL